jgi:hypothetical protein
LNAQTEAPYTRAVSDNYFLAENPAPDPASLAAALGGKYSLFERILEASEGFEKDWKHYGKKYGWKMKAHDGDKALFELTVTSADIRLSVAARESELERLRENPVAAALLAELLPPGKPKEGWGIRLSVSDEDSAGRAATLIRAVAAIRRGE